MHRRHCIQCLHCTPCPQCIHCEGRILCMRVHTSQTLYIMYTGHTLFTSYDVSDIHIVSDVHAAKIASFTHLTDERPKSYTNRFQRMEGEHIVLEPDAITFPRSLKKIAEKCPPFSPLLPSACVLACELHCVSSQANPVRHD